MPEIMDGMSMDLERANMDKLRSVFPECFAEGKLDIDVKEMCFYEDEKELIFSNPFQTEDNDACTDFKINLEKFIKALVGESYEKELDAFLKEEDEGGLYDISYDIKSLIEVNDCFIESTIFPILKSIAYNRKEGRR